MSTPSERKELIAQIHDYPAKLEALVGKYSQAQLDTPVRPGEWTIRQIVHHVADAHCNGYFRTKLILTETKPILKPYDQEAWAKLNDVRLPVETSFLILRGLHERWTKTFDNLPEASWERVGVHLENGLMTLDKVLVSYVQHGETHLEQIRQLARSE